MMKQFGLIDIYCLRLVCSIFFSFAYTRKAAYIQMCISTWMHLALIAIRDYHHLFRV